MTLENPHSGPILSGGICVHVTHSSVLGSQQFESVHRQLPTVHRRRNNPRSPLYHRPAVDNGIPKGKEGFCVAPEQLFQVDRDYDECTVPRHCKSTCGGLFISKIRKERLNDIRLGDSTFAVRSLVGSGAVLSLHVAKGQQRSTGHAPPFLHTKLKENETPCRMNHQPSVANLVGVFLAFRKEDIHRRTRLADIPHRISKSKWQRAGLVACITDNRRGRKVFEWRSRTGLCSVEQSLTRVLSTVKRKRESSFAIITETPSSSRPTSPRSLPIEIKHERISPFKGRGFREETSRHNTPKTSRTSSRASSPLRRRTNSLSKIDNMAQTATLPPIAHTLSRPHSPRNYIKENIEEVREMSGLNREKHEAEAEEKRREEEEALLKEMGLLDQNAKLEPVRSLGGSRTTSRSNSPNKIKFRSRSNSPSTAILLFEDIPKDNTDLIDPNDSVRKPVTHKSRVRSVSRSQPQSNNGSPQHSKIPKRQNSVSPTRTTNKRDSSVTKRPVENNLNKNQRFISNSTSSIQETIKIGGTTSDLKKNMSKSTQHLSISPANIKGKPPISPGRGGPPPSNRAINAKRLSPIAGTPNKSPVEDSKPSSARPQSKSPSPVSKKPVKTAGNTPATSRLNSRQQSRHTSRSQSPDKKKDIPIKSTTASKGTVNKTITNKPITRTPSTRTLQKTSISSKSTKPDIQKPINRTNSIKNLSRTPSTKTLNTKPPTLKKKDSMKDLKNNVKSIDKTDDSDKKSNINKQKIEDKKSENKKDKDEIIPVETGKKESTTETHEEKPTQDSETQYDKITNEKGELVTLTKKNVVSMTTAAITAQPLEVVTTVTNQLPAALEKAREKGIFERLSSKDSLAPKEVEDKSEEKGVGDSNTEKEMKVENDTKTVKTEQNDTKTKIQPTVQPTQNKTTVIVDDSVKLKPLQPPFNNPQVEKVKQKIDDILKAPEVSPENILKAVETEIKSARSAFRNAADKTKNDVKEDKDEKLNNIMKEINVSRLIKDEKEKVSESKERIEKKTEKVAEEIRSEATKIVDSIITPVEEPPKELVDALKEKTKDEVKKNIEPIVMVVNEKRNGPKTTDTLVKMNETLVKGEPEVEVQSSNVSTPNVSKITVYNKMADSNSSDQSAHSNGG
ncbi:hypothetical protein EVAR_79171_1 [Eumeta japonica]|uniref:Uncharacterized protein n=1 Tax=Eumeta variegata TaxID=151549 RepID=A0A4C1UUF3_EUMVA|nr:hypothetical protein EVAR_79171_1 [Eumeta japonica]